MLKDEINYQVANSVFGLETFPNIQKLKQFPGKRGFESTHDTHLLFSMINDNKLLTKNLNNYVHDEYKIIKIPNYCEDLNLAMEAALKLKQTSTDKLIFNIVCQEDNTFTANISPIFENTFNEVYASANSPAKALCAAILLYKGFTFS